MGSRSNSRRSRGTKRGLASFVSFVVLFALALGQGSSLIALADDASRAPLFRRHSRPPAADESSGDSVASSDDRVASAPRTAPKRQPAEHRSSGRTGVLAAPRAPGGSMAETSASTSSRPVPSRTTTTTGVGRPVGTTTGRSARRRRGGVARGRRLRVRRPRGVLHAGRGRQRARTELRARSTSTMPSAPRRPASRGSASTTSSASASTPATPATSASITTRRTSSPSSPRTVRRQRRRIDRAPFGSRSRRRRDS